MSDRMKSHPESRTKDSCAQCVISSHIPQKLPCPEIKFCQCKPPMILKHTTILHTIIPKFVSGLNHNRDTDSDLAPEMRRFAIALILL